MTRTRYKLFAVAMMVTMALATFAPAVGAATVQASGNDGGNTGDDTAGNAPADGAFGQNVSSFVHSLVQQQQAGNTQGPIGLQIAAFVTANNPGQGNGPPAFVFNASDNRGPPAFVVGNAAGPGAENASTDGGERGPPENAGSDSETDDSDDSETKTGTKTDDSGERGPPDDRGPDDDERGPPENAGSDSETDDSDDSETKTETETDDSGERGPPENAGSDSETDDSDSPGNSGNAPGR